MTLIIKIVLSVPIKDILFLSSLALLLNLRLARLTRQPKTKDQMVRNLQLDEPQARHTFCCSKCRHYLSTRAKRFCR